MSEPTRRTFIAGAVGAMTLTTAAVAAELQPVEGKKGAPILGPRNPQREAQNPDIIQPPSTDSGAVPNLHFSYADAHIKMREGGWSREVTERELPISTTIAGVNMRLTPGGVRELHWHKEAEWAYMLAGKARITAVDQDGRNFIADVGEGDLWYFPEGVPHSIQGLDEGAEFLLAFTDGSFSEDSTFALTGMMKRFPKEVLAKNFGVSAETFSPIPKEERFIFQSTLPPKLQADTVSSPKGEVPKTMAFRLGAQKPLVTKGGRVRIADSSNFPVSTGLAAALVEVDPGHMREIHWHPNADEWQYYISGKGRMTVFASQDAARTFDYQAGDVGYVPAQMPHYVENTGSEPLRFLELFSAPRFEDISLKQWLALVPPELVAAHLNLDPKFAASLSKDKQPVV